MPDRPKCESQRGPFQAISLLCQTLLRKQYTQLSLFTSYRLDFFSGSVLQRAERLPSTLAGTGGWDAEASEREATFPPEPPTPPAGRRQEERPLALVSWWTSVRSDLQS